MRTAVLHASHGPLLTTAAPKLCLWHCHVKGCLYVAGAESDGLALGKVMRHYQDVHAAKQAVCDINGVPMEQP